MRGQLPTENIPFYMNHQKNQIRITSQYYEQNVTFISYLSKERMLCIFGIGKIFEEIFTIPGILLNHNMGPSNPTDVKLWFSLIFA